MEISIIIPTYNRPLDLDECLNSVLEQTRRPLEVLIVDNSTNNDSMELVKQRKNEFANKKILLEYLKNQNENSLTVARNIGVGAAKGEIVLFLDDDVVLEKGYLQQIIEVYEKYPRVRGVQGYIRPEKPSRIRNLVYKLFFLYHLEKNKCRALPSVSATYPGSLDKVVFCQWLSGANHSFKREIYQDFQYDPNLKKYSDGEDLEFSYRVFKKYPDGLYITPRAKLVHKTSPTGRAATKEATFMMEIYGLYLFYKLFKPSITNICIYIWSRFGRLVLALGRMAAQKGKSGCNEVKYLLAAYLSCLAHLKEIARGDIDFFNKKLTD
jgi:GT2 family glycosyltransferase